MSAVIFDVDGTLADCSHRLHYVKHGKRDWDSFFAVMNYDTIIKPVREVLWALRAAGKQIVLCSGRPERYRQITEGWMVDNSVVCDALYMRPDGDTRADHVVKAQLLSGILADGYEVELVVDDRQSVVDMWRENGLMCLQCAPSDTEVPVTAVLSLMVGPSGAGKSTWLGSNKAAEYGIHLSHVVASDQIRSDLCGGDFRDQTKNDTVFDALHSVVKARLRAGLSAVVDATNLRRKDRMAVANLMPSSGKVRYFVIDRPMADKRRDAGWRAELPIDLLEKHSQTFASQLSDILAGDNLPNVEVIDLREHARAA